MKPSVAIPSFYHDFEFFDILQGHNCEVLWRMDKAA